MTLSKLKIMKHLKIIFNLLKNEGLSLGPSSGINIAGAVMLAKFLGPGTLLRQFYAIMEQIF